MIVPLDAAHKILATFGITEPSPAYERWVKTEGFELNDLCTVLAPSEYLFPLDWRACLADELESIASALGKLGVHLEMDSSEDGETATVSVDGRSTALAYRTQGAETSWLAVIHGLQSIMPANIEFRESVQNGNSDTDVYAVLPNDEWADLDASTPKVVKALFRTLRDT